MSIGRCQQAQHFPGLRVPPQCLLGKDQHAVPLDLEPSAAGLDQFEFDVGIFLANLRRQTGSAGLVVSHHAEFDADVHDIRR
jgi:hypothetical protein